jgi:chlorophyll synthase
LSQLLLTHARPQPAAMLEVLKPITWFPPIWAFLCGLVSSGVPASGHMGDIVLGVLLCGPLVCGTSQAVNDWFDRHVDAINEPHRPIPSGRLPGDWGLRIAIGWTLLSFAVAALLGQMVFAATLVGMALAWAYSAPPLRLKRDGWFGNAAVGACYEGLPWITGAALMLGGQPNWRVFVAAVLYSLGCHGIMTLNDFKSIEGDRLMGVASIPVQMGVRASAWFACVIMLAPQLIMITLLAVWHRPWHGLCVAALVLVQLALMLRFLAKGFLADPKRGALYYSGFGVPFYVLGMLVAALALRGLT